MTNAADAIARSFDRHDAFQPAPGSDAFELTTSPLDVVVTTGADRIVVTVIVPTVGAVAAEDVPSVVVDGWIETFERRVDDPSGATRTDRVDVTVTREGDELVVDASLEPAPDRAADEAKAVADFVEGTWVGGLVPGYDYDPPAAALLEAAAERGST